MRFYYRNILQERNKEIKEFESNFDIGNSKKYKLEAI